MIKTSSPDLNTDVPIDSDRHRPMFSRLQTSGTIFVVCGVWLVAVGLFLVPRPALLPEDSRFIGGSMETLRSAGPGLERWLNHVFNVMAGLMVATGTMTLLAAIQMRERRGTLLTLFTLVVAGAASVGLMSVTNFLIDSHFRWLVLFPALLWLASVLCNWRGRTRSKKPTGESDGVVH